MSSQNLIIYNFPKLYYIFNELGLDFKFQISSADNKNDLEKKIKESENYLILSNEKNLNIHNQIIFENIPINIFKLIEKINIKFLKIQFQRQSKINIKDYILDLNSREMYKNIDKLKLTEKEINTIVYLSNANVSVSIDELRKQVWSYQSNMETHTVETHIYRLRQKIFSIFGDNEFIISKKDGYQIK